MESFIQAYEKEKKDAIRAVKNITTPGQSRERFVLFFDICGW